MFDVAMGSYYDAEVCELVGLYILHKLTTAFAHENIGLYRDGITSYAYGHIK